tara:strand:- start:2 stop:145 length:144 start_codon:yes stop_codon:yes gene_type:complete
MPSSSKGNVETIHDGQSSGGAQRSKHNPVIDSNDFEIEVAAIESASH